MNEVQDPVTGQSLPVWEEWIEIRQSAAGNHDKAGLFPYGKSGLKYPLAPLRLPERVQSLPVWEEWIEM